MTVYLGKKPVGVTKIVYREKPTDEWQPNPNWWDIQKILAEDTRDYPGKAGVILYNFSDVSEFTLVNYNIAAVATSDGAFYSYSDNGEKVTHHWDTSKDKDDGRGFKTRWVIYYYENDTMTQSFGGSHYGLNYNYIAYVVLAVNWANGYNFCVGQRLLESIKLLDGYHIRSTTFQYFCQNCHSLQALPKVLDTSSGTNFSYFLNGCNSLQSLPKVLDTSSGTNFSSFLSDCASLKSLPDALDTSSGTTFSNFLANCRSLQALPKVLDTSSGTNFSYFLNGCNSLQSLPKVLDTSSGTNFTGFCQNCNSLQSLPDTLDTSSGTNFTSFCQGCPSLHKSPEVTLAANTASISKYIGPFYGDPWLVEIPLTLPSNTNFWLDSSTRISIESFRYIADHAPDVTATPRTLTIGSTNISRINAADPTIITDLQAKGWSIQ